MNRLELAEALVAFGVNRRNYSVYGGFPDDAVCLDVLPMGKWVVYYSERGSRFDVVEFDNESSACTYMFELLVREPSVLMSDPAEAASSADNE